MKAHHHGHGHDHDHDLWREHFGAQQGDCFGSPSTAPPAPSSGGAAPYSQLSTLGPDHLGGSGGMAPDHQPATHANSLDPGHAPDWSSRFDDVLFSHLLGGAGGNGPIFIVPIEHLDVNMYNIVQNTLVENTNVLFDASHGGSIGVGGAVSALSDQTSFLQNAPPTPDPHLLG